MHADAPVCCAQQVHDWLLQDRLATARLGQQELKDSSVGRAMKAIVTTLNDCSSSDDLKARHTDQLDGKQSGYIGLKFTPPHNQN